MPTPEENWEQLLDILADAQDPKNWRPEFRAQWEAEHGPLGIPVEVAS